MYRPVVRGTYHEMGLNYGTILYKHGFRLDKQTPEKLEFGRKGEKEVKRVFPEILEEIEGFSEAVHASYEQASSFMFGIGAFKVKPQCSAFAALTGSDVIFGRNYDFYDSFKKYTESYLTCPMKAYWSLGHSDVFIGREDGVNEKGLAIAMTGVSEKTIKPGLSFCLLVRAVLDKCATTEEAVGLLSDARICSADNFLVADREGNVAVVEASPDRTRVRKSEKDEGFIVCTNHFVLPEMQDMEDLTHREKSNWDTIPRYETITGMLKERKGKIDAQYAQKILSNHSGYVCSHQKKIKLSTLWSIIATLKEPQIFRAEGTPCRSKYNQDLRLSKSLQRRKTP